MIQNVKKVLCPVDFSEFSLEAMRGAWELAKDVDADLHLLHVVVPHRVFIPLPTVQSVERTREQARESAMVQEAEEALTHIKKADFQNSAKVTIAATAGSPVEKILEYAASNDIDLIVVSTHGRSGLNRMFIGSVAEKLVRGALCSVLVLRARA